MQLHLPTDIDIHNTCHRERKEGRSMHSVLCIVLQLGTAAEATVLA